MPPATPMECLQKLADIVSAATKQHIALASQRDAALVWSAAAVHPLRPLENAYQGIVRNAVRGITDDGLRREVESSAMGRFFFFDVDAPRLLGVQRDAPYLGVRFPFTEDLLSEARRELKRASQDVNAYAQNPQSPAAFGINDRVEDALTKACRHAGDALNRFRSASSNQRGDPIDDVPRLRDVKMDLVWLLQQIRSGTTLRQFRRIRVALADVIRRIERALVELAAVQMFYAIDPFLLFRLLVRYRIESERKIPDETSADVSGKLTGLLNNERNWLVTFLRDSLVDLDRALQAVDPSGNTLFFLKGGRALMYLVGTPDLGENDWDTQIVINPNLPPDAWNDLFVKVHNEVLLRLRRYKLQFFMLLYRQADAFMQSLIQEGQQPPPGAAPADAADDAPDVEPVPDPPVDDEDIIDLYVFPRRERANCKAELIDIGIPRRDTVEALEQWAALYGPGRILRANDGIPYPAYLYYIEEYTMMARGAFSPGARALRKIPKRVRRLYQMLTLPDQGLSNAIEQEKQHIPPALLPVSLLAVGQIVNQAVQRELIVLLRQFSQAYDLGKEPGLSQAFDTFFTQNWGKPASRAPLPKALADAIAEAAGKGEWGNQYQELVDAFAFITWISARMESHLRARAQFMSAERQQMIAFVRSVYGASFFSSREELEIQIAVSRSLAAHLQAEYASFPRPGDLEPFTRVDMTLYRKHAQADVNTVLDLVQPAIAQALAAPGAPPLREQRTPGAIRLFWKTPVTFDDPAFTYAPLMFELTVAPAPEGFPLLAFVWGMPAVALRDLIGAYRRRSAETQEVGMRRRLLETADALLEILTTLEDPELPDSTLVGLARGTVHHLMLSSEAYANGHIGDYPPAYYV